MIVPLDDGRILADRHMLAELYRRPALAIRRWCEPVACAVATRAVLYDSAAAEAALKAAAARQKRAGQRALSPTG